MDIIIKRTERGFSAGDFTDLYGEACSIQESSLATDDALWLGCNKGTHHEGDCMARMHLSREMAAALIPLLQHFVDTGYLPAAEDYAKTRLTRKGRNAPSRQCCRCLCFRAVAEYLPRGRTCFQCREPEPEEEVRA